MVLVATFIPSLLGAITILYESPRWLLMNGDADHATAILKEVARVNGNKYPDSAQLRQPSRDLDLDASAPGGGGGGGGGGAGAAKSSVSLATLFTHPELRRRQLVMMLGWFTCSFVFYGISIVGSGLSSDPYTGLITQSVAEIPGIILAIVLLDWRRTGRRGSLALTFAGSGLAMLLLAGAGSSHTPSLRTALALLGKMGITAAFAIVYILPIELIPTCLRVGSMGLCSMFARVGGIIAPFVLLLGAVVGPGGPFLLFAIPAILSAVLTLRLPETLGKPLPQTISDVTPTTMSWRLSG